jgi:hypothetical protein
MELKNEELHGIQVVLRSIAVRSAQPQVFCTWAVATIADCLVLATSGASVPPLPLGVFGRRWPALG